MRKKDPPSRHRGGFPHFPGENNLVSISKFISNLTMSMCRFMLYTFVNCSSPDCSSVSRHHDFLTFISHFEICQGHKCICSIRLLTLFWVKYHFSTTTADNERDNPTLNIQTIFNRASLVSTFSGYSNQRNQKGNLMHKLVMPLKGVSRHRFHPCSLHVSRISHKPQIRF